MPVCVFGVAVGGNNDDFSRLGGGGGRAGGGGSLFLLFVIFAGVIFLVGPSSRIVVSFVYARYLDSRPAAGSFPS